MNKKKKDSLKDADSSDLIIPAARKIGSCMTRRNDIVWIDAASKQQAILERVREYPCFSYFPVCAQTVDAVLGVLSARDFLLSLQDAQWVGLKALVSKPVFIPETVSVAQALGTIAETDSRVALIIDEYGGIDGMVTRNGLVAELLKGLGTKEGDGEIERREDGTWLVSGQARMEELAGIFKFPETGDGSRNYDTIAGYLLSSKGSIPRVGDVVEAGSWVCKIVGMDGHRISSVLVSPARGSPPENLAGETGER